MVVMPVSPTKLLIIFLSKKKLFRPEPVYEPDDSWLIVDLVNHRPENIQLYDAADDSYVLQVSTSANEIFLKHSSPFSSVTVLPKVHIYLGGQAYNSNPVLRGSKSLRVKQRAQTWLDELRNLLASGNSPFSQEQDEALASQINRGFSPQASVTQLASRDCFKPDETIGYFFWSVLSLLNDTYFLSPTQRMGDCSANESEGAIPNTDKLKQAIKNLSLIKHSEGFDDPHYAYNNQELAKLARHYLSTQIVTDGKGDENDDETKLAELTATYFEQDNLTDIASLFINAIKLLKHLREPGLIRHVETRREYKLKAHKLTYQPIELKQRDFISFKLHSNYKYEITSEDKSARFIGRFNPQGQLLVKIPEKWAHIKQWDLESTPVENDFVDEFFPTLKSQYQKMLSMPGFTVGESDVGAVYGYATADPNKYMPKVAAGMQIVGSGFSLAFAAAIGATGVGVPLAGAIGFIAIDNMQAGLRTLFSDTNDITQTYGAEFLEWSGLVPEGYGELVYGLGDITLATKAGFLIKAQGQLYNIVKIKPIQSVQSQQVFKAEEISIAVTNIEKNQHHVLNFKNADNLVLTEIKANNIIDDTVRKIKSPQYSGKATSTGTKPISHLEKQTYKRPSGYRKGIREKVWDNSKEIDGVVRDPLTQKPMEFKEPWDMGHKPGYEFRKHQQSSTHRGITRKEFLDEHNDPSHYRPELPSSNRSHAGEDVTNKYFGP